MVLIKLWKNKTYFNFSLLTSPSTSVSEASELDDFGRCDGTKLLFLWCWMFSFKLVFLWCWMFSTKLLFLFWTISRLTFCWRIFSALLHGVRRQRSCCTGIEGRDSGWFEERWRRRKRKIVGFEEKEKGKEDWWINFALNHTALHLCGDVLNSFKSH